MRYSLFALAAASTALASPHVHRRGHGAHANLFARSHGAPAPEECVCSTYVTSRVYAVTVPVAVATPAEVVPSSSAAPSEAVVTVVPVYESDADETTTIAVPTTAYETSVSYVDVPAPTAETPKPETPKPETPKPETPKPETPKPEAEIPKPEGPVPVPEYSTFTQPGTYTIPASTITISSTVVTCVAEETTLHPGTQTYGGITTNVPAPTTLTVPYATIETIEDVTTSKVYETVYVCPTAGDYTVGASTTVVESDTPVTYVVPTEIVPGTYTQPEQTVTVTKTNQVVVCPYESETAVPEAPSSAPVAVPTPEVEEPKPTPEAVKPTPKPAPVEEPSYESTEETTEEVEAPKQETPKKETPKKETPKTEVTTPKPSGDSPWSISYSPYEDSGECRSAEGVMEDIADIASKGFKNVRVYGTECSTLENVGAACKASGIKMIIGVFIKGDLSSGDAQVKDIVSWAQWDLVTLIVIGNEAIFNGYTDAAGLKSYINTNKALIQGAGYTGSFTTAETLGVLQGNGVADALCSCIDIVGVNIQVYFDGQRDASEAGDFFKSQIDDSGKICPGKEVFVLEAGWPSAGSAIGVAKAGKTEQAIAIEGMNKVAPGHVSFFTYKNDLWKAPADHIEANFGCGDLF